MTVRDAIRQLEALDEVREAGSVPTDVGQILCFRAVVTDASAFTDGVQQRVVSAVQRGIHGDMKITVSKDITERPDGEDECFFWVFAYKVFGTDTIGGIEYDIIEWSDEGGVTAVMADMTGGHPTTGIERFRWSELTWRPDEPE